VPDKSEKMPDARRPISSRQNDESSVSKVERTSSAVSSTSQTLVQESGASQCPSEEESFDLESNIFLYRDSHFHHIANIVGTLISSMIPIGSIVVLYFVSDMPIRLAILSLFTAIFSIALSLVTSATRVEIFAATAA
jgi:hypothetical protein